MQDGALKHTRRYPTNEAKVLRQFGRREKESGLLRGREGLFARKAYGVSVSIAISS